MKIRVLTKKRIVILALFFFSLTVAKGQAQEDCLDVYDNGIASCSVKRDKCNKHMYHVHIEYGTTVNGLKFARDERGDLDVMLLKVGRGINAINGLIVRMDSLTDADRKEIENYERRKSCDAIVHFNKRVQTKKWKEKANEKCIGPKEGEFINVLIWVNDQALEEGRLDAEKKGDAKGKTLKKSFKKYLRRYGYRKIGPNEIIWDEYRKPTSDKGPLFGDPAETGDGSIVGIQ